MAHRNFIRLVEQGYDRMARDYTAWRNETPLLFDAELRELAEQLPANALVLDAGCGAGMPVTQFLAQRFRTIGVDLSLAQLWLAQRNVPRAQFAQQDMTALGFAAHTFDALACFYALIHVPREQHANVLADFARVLKPGGALLIVTGNNDNPAEVDTFFGAPMFWSHFDRATSVQMIRTAGFEMVWDKIVSDRPSGSHTLVLAKARP